uniref:Uncharacterized protein n=1 Tax=Glossina palpalis gambiensis TaxID=67801 RepID=A0A1B0BYQ9_9MUSC
MLHFEPIKVWEVPWLLSLYYYLYFVGARYPFLRKSPRTRKTELVLLDDGLYEEVPAAVRKPLCKFWEATVLNHEHRMFKTAQQLVAYMFRYCTYRPRQPQFSRIPRIVSHPSLTAPSSIHPSQTIPNSINFSNHYNMIKYENTILTTLTIRGILIG